MRQGGMIVIGVIVLIVGIVASSSMFTVRETEQVLVRQFGEPRRVITEPGLNFKIPFIQTATYFDKRLLDFDAERQEIPTRDQKQLVVDAYARYRITDPLKFFQTVGTVYGFEARLGNIINSALREVLGDVPMSVVLSAKRADLLKRISDRATRDSRGFGVDVVDVRMRRVDLPDENSQAIYRRMQTQREQEARKIRAEGDKDARAIRADADKQKRVIVAEANKKAEILRGEGDAKAQGIYNAAYGKDPKFFDFYRSMQAMQKGLNPETTTFVGTPDSDFFRFFRNEDGAAKASTK